MNKRIEQQRFKLFSWLGAFLSQANVRVVEDVPEDSIIVVSRVADWRPRHNDLWRMQANKSFPRDVTCMGGCGHQIVMSNAMWDKFVFGGRVAIVKCSKCIFKI